ncbi:hypothetical protein [Candidatus Parabeggiatoa sp. HSG14]|uniref:hypothetical protein n=1 Tax=Candidatus Parabeggiatoa sp. HSG14 TaxID=3055593 RepID=UPI0025A8597C|nr:hypothetical protein [Thiotrichales bacterium HSG14]
MEPTTIKVNHEELIRDYAGYEFIQDEMEAVIKRFLQLYYPDILMLYEYQESSAINTLEVIAAGAGASKFVFGVLSVDCPTKLIFGIRLYNSKGFMRDGNKTYENAEAYKVNLETYDRELVEALVDEIRIHEELEQEAKTSIEIKKVWTRFPLDKGKSKNAEHGRYINEFSYIGDQELKCLLVNLGINAITVGGFIVGYDGKKILERDEFQPEYKQNAIAHICNTMLQSWLFTVRYGDRKEIVSRTIVDLKPAQFVVQSEETKVEALMPAIVIDVGPAENTDDIYTYVKNIAYMKELVSAFAGEMLVKLALPEQEKQQARQFIYEGIVGYLNQCKQTEAKPKTIKAEEFVNLVDEFLACYENKMS